MRIAVAGGTGTVGRLLVEELKRRHQPVVIARSKGVDLGEAEGLATVLEGVDALVDVTNVHAANPTAAEEAFGTVTRNLLTAAHQVGVAHHVLLSIVGVDRVSGIAHFAGKRRQEALVRAAPIHATILRASPFYEFAEMVVRWTRVDDAATVPPLIVQPVAARDAAATLAELAAGTPGNQVLELAGPEMHDLVDMARRVCAARNETITLVPSWGGAFPTEIPGDALLPAPTARIAPTTFKAWLAAQTERERSTP